MRCKTFWIGLFVLSITLFLGITVSEFIELKYLPEIEAVEENNLETNVKNCEPIDKELKSQILPYTENEKIDSNGGIILIPVPPIISNDKQDENKLNSDGIVKDAPMDPPINLEKDKNKLLTPLTEDYAEYKNLLYKQVCREKEIGRK
jgi:hypothetical protein